MAVKTDSPQIIALRKAVEGHFGHSIESRTDFSILVLEIERVTHEHVAENTLRRLWGKIKGYDTVFTRTLDVLCRYIGYEHWEPIALLFRNPLSVSLMLFLTGRQSMSMSSRPETASGSVGFQTASA